MKQVLIQSGKAVVENVPAPQIEPGRVLVRTFCSCVSAGTELGAIRHSGLPLWRRALAKPQKIGKVIGMVSTQGLAHTWVAIQGKLAAGVATGYSAAGIVLEVGAGIDDLYPGDRIACAGAQYAHHAEIIRVPRNLVVPIPDSVSFHEACTTTLGAIALQGVRRAHPTLGETFVVIGLGVIGQLTVQLLKTNGCRVIAADLDPARAELARTLGADALLGSNDGCDGDQVARLTGGLGADGVIITAATPSDTVVSAAFKMCRRKGRVVLVGDVGLNLNRADFYQKEIDFLISTSYGPGRYDSNYEERNLDYPAPYVRWTENRNMSEFLSLVAQRKINLAPLIATQYPVEQAEAGFQALQTGAPKPMTVILVYPQPETMDGPLAHTVANPLARPVKSDRIRLALVGAGGFAKGMHLPNIQALASKFHVYAVVSRTGHNALATAQSSGAKYSSTDMEEVLKDPNVDAVLIATRHNTHADLALKALKAGKHVLLEKPLALTAGELSSFDQFISNTGAAGPVLLTGFNRRFSQYARRIAEWLRNRTNPMIINYRMNAGFIPSDHWVHGPEGGGRNLGEACHIYDLFTFLTQARSRNVSVHSLRPTNAHYSPRDNFIATISFDDGSIATLTYTALGTAAFPKELMEIYVDGKVIVLEDYRKLSLFGGKGHSLATATPDKGQKDELIAFADSLLNGKEWPIAWWQQMQATRIALDVEAALT